MTQKKLSIPFIVSIPLLLISATLGTGIAKAHAETGIIRLLEPSSPTWYGSSSGYTSPDGTWKIVFPGAGHADVKASKGDKILEVAPKLSDSTRHSTLVLAKEVHMTGIHGKMKVRLDQQSSNPKPWDSFWAQLAYVDKTTQINLVIKTDNGGWAVNKRDHDHEGQDLHVAIASGHSIPSAEKRHWYYVEWWIKQNHDTNRLHIKVKVDGNLLVDKDDDKGYDRDGHTGSGTSPYFFKSADKTFAAYSEKSHTSWRDISVEEI